MMPGPKMEIRYATFMVRVGATNHLDKIVRGFRDAVCNVADEVATEVTSDAPDTTLDIEVTPIGYENGGE